MITKYPIRRGTRKYTTDQDDVGFHASHYRTYCDAGCSLPGLSRTDEIDVYDRTRRRLNITSSVIASETTLGSLSNDRRFK